MKLKVFFIYIVFNLLIYFILDFEKNNKIKQHLEKQTQLFYSLYTIHYNNYKKQTQVLYDLLIDNEKVINIYQLLNDATPIKKNKLREELYLHLKDKYMQLEHINLKQLHFHLKNNASFLRMHQPSKFGDNLSQIRETVSYTNRTHKKIDGFEMGRVYSGLRFIFPIFNKQNEYLGSVELSFDISVFSVEFMEQFKVLSNFYLDSKIINNKVWKEYISKYHTLSDIEGYYFENKSNEAGKKYAQKLNEEVPNITNKVLFLALRYVKKGKKISLYDNDNKKIITFLPIKNPVTNKVVAFFTIFSGDTYIQNKIKNFYFICVLMFLISSLIFYLIIKEFINQGNFYKKENASKLEEKNKQLIHQDKLSSMGEMLANISHQWRQPLSGISAILMNIESKIDSIGLYNNSQKDETLNFILQKNEKIREHINYLSDTIDLFSNFIKKQRENKELIVQESIEKSLDMVNSEYKRNFIDIKKDIYFTPLTIVASNDELSQVLINILNNAKDIIVERKIKEPWIEIILQFDKSRNNIILTIEDNAGGIPSAILPKVFDAYFSTKHSTQGTGLGLYMSYKIIKESLKGQLYVKNENNGAKFYIIIPRRNL